MRRVPSSLIVAVLVLWLAEARPALAHGRNAHSGPPTISGPHNRHELGRAWELEPGVVIPLAITALLYGRGLWRMWRNAGCGRGVRRWEAFCFITGWLALVIALVSPLHPWGNVLFSAHMIQHEILMLVAAPLLVLGKPVVAILKSLPSGWAAQAVRWTNARWWQAVWRVICNSFVAWMIHAAVLWVWHIPALFQATLDDEFLHAVQHLSFLLSALLFWWALLHGRRYAINYGLAAFYMFTTAMHSGLLGALITLATSLWYPAYSETTASWGLTPLEDQHLGGLIMWVPACLVYVVAGLALFAGWLRASEERVLRWEATLSASAVETSENVRHSKARIP